MSRPPRQAPSFDGEQSNEDLVNEQAHSGGIEDDDIDFDAYRDPLEGGTTCLNLVVRTYSPSWKARHGWRELY
jgi:hypothetical protein